ncbi:MAG: hypothetical protein IPL87_04150 [Candidatus Moraniibacteriota bacterium]|nr:MAG: hypothetical protein IPL87_04150 [Candidatus Moranbacteria bacterium]
MGAEWTRFSEKEKDMTIFSYVQDLQFSFEDWRLTRTPKEGALKKHVRDEECATEWHVVIIFSLSSSLRSYREEAFVRLEPHAARVVRVDWGEIDNFTLIEGLPIEEVPMDGAFLVPYGDFTLQGRDNREVCSLLGGSFKLLGVEHPSLEGRIFQLAGPFEIEFVA